MIELEDRILLNNGISIVSTNNAFNKLLNEGELPEHIRVEPSNDANLFNEKYNKDVCINADDVLLNPTFEYTEEEFEELLNNILENPRDNTDNIDHLVRIEDEIEFFIKNDNQGFLCTLKRLIDKFKEDNVIWGVGRGSSCSCYVLYLLEVHDINPIKYDIPFKEFSKED